MILHQPEYFSGVERDYEEEFTIVPIGDVQMMDPNIEEGPQFNRKEFERHLRYVEDTYPNPMYLGMGDYIDFMSPSNREAVKAARVYNQSRSYIDEMATELAEDFVALMEHTRGRWLGMLAGHHFYQFRNGQTTDMYIANQLDAMFLGTVGHVTVQFDAGGRRAGKLNIWASHGQGSRKYPAGKIVDVVVPHWPDVDLFFMGHMHESDAARIPRYRVTDDGEIVTDNALAVVTGAWLEPVVAPGTTYIEEKMIKPRATGAPVVIVSPYRDERGRRRRRFRYVSEV